MLKPAEAFELPQAEPETSGFRSFLLVPKQKHPWEFVPQRKTLKGLGIKLVFKVSLLN